MEDYKYDVAFSFLQQDEQLALQLSDLIQDRLRTFVYSKQQGEIAGTDGEKKFVAVFGQEARTVVVLYREGWGTTSWTRIEETAIRNRAFEKGYNFVLFIPLDNPPSTPEWLPRTRLWIGLLRWGPQGAASVIEARVQELGGSVREETAQDRAARLRRTIEFEKRRNLFIHSTEGVQAADRQFGLFNTEIESQIAGIKHGANEIDLVFKTSKRLIVVVGFGLSLEIRWQPHYTNSLEDAELTVTIWQGHAPFPGLWALEQPRRVDTRKYLFNLIPSGDHVWQDGKAKEQSFSTHDLVEHCLTRFMDAIEARRRT